MPPIPCFGGCQSDAGFQQSPTLFRIPFFWNPEFGSTARLRFSVTYDDGLILYLNGSEILRDNVAGALAPPAITTWSLAPIAAPACRTNVVLTVTNLMPGNNWVAAAVVQAANTASDLDTVFGLRLDATAYVPGSLFENPLTALRIISIDTNLIRLSWAGRGYSLETSTNLTEGSVSYPIGPWHPVTNMSNPYTNRIGEIQRYFRLKK